MALENVVTHDYNTYTPEFKETHATPDGKRTFGIRKANGQSNMFVITLSGKGDLPARFKGQWTSVDMAERAVKSYLAGLADAAKANEAERKTLSLNTDTDDDTEETEKTEEAA